MDAKFGPDGALYVLDYGGGFFTSTPSRRCGRSATPAARRRRARRRAAIPIGAVKVKFSKGGSGGVSYQWDFGDGTTSTEANPTHTYAEAGATRRS